jgi:hypothetical protein
VRRHTGFLIASVTVAVSACGSGGDPSAPAVDGAVEEATDDEAGFELGEWTGMEVPSEWPSEIPIPEARLVGWSDTSNSTQKRVETTWNVPGSTEPELLSFIEEYLEALRAAGFVDSEGVARSDLSGGDFSLDGEFVGAERTLAVTASVAGDTAKLYVRIPDVVFTMP